MSTLRTVKHRYLRTRVALHNTVQKLLDLNKRRYFFKDDPKQQDTIAEEIKVLNATADLQHRSMKVYERQIAELKAAAA